MINGENKLVFTVRSQLTTPLSILNQRALRTVESVILEKRREKTKDKFTSYKQAGNLKTMKKKKIDDCRRREEESTGKCLH
jgi:hypothetical protein